ncbi:YeeE/YedE thiosulfate transporter family protein [Zoogloea sp.]|uniref:YeeE/YedE thiosulfate transporter family protein n=1 Tax=Zoogloea sp. TaxID=49181 RepID=UPI0026051D5A|nr:YeeE/YedE thiosulfate transporter family protein [Zoogloea sp.]MDD3353068.1 YeeE/YedE thiosulfate transporter family protein [Zoogloea sp.]
MSALLGAGLLLGSAFGATARAGEFCLLRGLRQARAGQEGAPALRAWALALATALAATQGLALLEQIDPSQAQVVRRDFSPLALTLGGLLFGLGMVLSRCCGARALVLLGGGNLRALITLLSLALTAQAALTGALAPLRQALQSVGALQLEHGTLPAWLLASGLPSGPALATATLLPLLLLLAYALGGGHLLRQAPRQALGALVIGLLAGAGWWITAHVEVDPFEPAPLTSLSYIGPLAESLLFLQLAVGRDASLGPAVVLGTLAGAGVVALASGRFRLEGFDTPRRLLASLAGGALMGLGGVLAVGCSIGQGLSGLSTLAFSSLPACAGMLLGIHLGLQAQPPHSPQEGTS